MKSINRQSIPKGYHLAPSLLKELRILQQRSLVKSILTLVVDYASIYIVSGIFIVFSIYNQSVFLLVFLWVIGMLFLARYLRALEVLVHEGSHYNLAKSKIINDVITCLFAAWPSFYLLGPYRTYHLPHHQEFGREGDTDRKRFLEMGFNTLVRTKPFRFVSQLIALYPQYIVGWYQTIGSDPRALVAGLVTHIMLYIVPFSIFTGSLVLGTIFWSTLIVIPSLIILPAIRLVVEASEHDYLEKTVFTCSFTNNGLIHWYFHPHNDGLHLLHHLMPSIPYSNLKKAQALLEKMDPNNFYSRQRRRSSLFQEPLPS
jgi:fatty acid desaturase